MMSTVQVANLPSDDPIGVSSHLEGSTMRTTTTTTTTSTSTSPTTSTGRSSSRRTGQNHTTMDQPAAQSTPVGADVYRHARTANVERSIVDDRPYLPGLDVKVFQPETAAYVVERVLHLTPHAWKELQVTPVTGGNTNTLFRVSGIQPQHYDGHGPLGNRHRNHQEQYTKDLPSCSDTSSSRNYDSQRPDSVLVRVFGGHGMIDRDVETATFAALSKVGIAPPYFGRFGNGRIEGWKPMRTLQIREMGIPNISKGIATCLGHLHAHFHVPSELRQAHDPNKPTMWTQLYAWLQQALQSKFQNDRDAHRALTLNLTQLKNDLRWLQESVVPSTAKVGFCHNDLLAANILWTDATQEIQFIDFEYGGVNYFSFDIANHFNEYAGGTDGSGVPNYDWFPSESQQATFVTHYLRAKTGQEPNHGEIQVLLTEIHAFLMANHLYWGLWAVNQAATEGCHGFDYLLYATHRIRQYQYIKNRQV